MRVSEPKAVPLREVGGKNSGEIGGPRVDSWYSMADKVGRRCVIVLAGNELKVCVYVDTARLSTDNYQL